MKCCCYKCKTEVPASVQDHFTASTGIILCEKCSIGVEPCSDRTKQWLIDNERK